MANPLRDFFFGTVRPKVELTDAVVPQRTFQDVILPVATRRALDHALIQIKKHDLIFFQWGLAERHGSGLGLAFNFAGPPGTGKTICAEAIAHSLGKNLMVVRYSEMESLWAGETGKNVSSVFRAAEEQDAVLFFDEADAIAGRRFASVTQGYQREANTVVNVLLKELEDFSGVVIFATNLAANFDPAFERRIRTHILFEMPGAAERAEIWKVQLHAKKTPLADDVDFEELGRKYEVAGGEIKNAVLKAAQMATAEPGPDDEKRIHQRHFVTGMEDVISSKKVMEQSLYDPSSMGDGSHAMSAMTGLTGAWSQLSQSHEDLENEVTGITQRLGEIELRSRSLPGIVERFDEAGRSAQIQLRAELVELVEKQGSRLDELAGGWKSHVATVEELKTAQAALAPRLETVEKTQSSFAPQLEELRAAIVAQIEEKYNRISAELDKQTVVARDALQTAIDQSERRWRVAQLIMGATICCSLGMLIFVITRLAP